MKVLVFALASVLVTAECSNLLQTLSLPDKEFTPTSQHSSQGYHYKAPTTACADGQVLHVDGRCVTPIITRSVYHFTVPQQPRRPTPLPYIPPPRVDHNILFVRLHEELKPLDPIVVAPPQQKNIVYVLRKNARLEGPKVIEVPAPPKTNPDVYFVGYDYGENPTLPTGEDLNSVLSHDAHELYGQVVNAGSSASSIDGDHFGQDEIGSYDHVDSSPPLPVAGFGTLDHESVGPHIGAIENILPGTATIDTEDNNQGNSVPPFNYYIPPYQFSRH